MCSKCAVNTYFNPRQCDFICKNDVTIYSSYSFFPYTLM